jgi:hypothetical protein
MKVRKRERGEIKTVEKELRRDREGQGRERDGNEKSSLFSSCCIS